MELSDNVTVLERDGKKFYLIGTAHVSQASVDEVNAVIESVQPDTVCVELCQTRYDALTDENRWQNLDIFKVIKEGKTLLLLANLAVGAYQRRLGDTVGVKPGAELLAAAEKAHEVGAKLVLADREIQITLKRTWGNLSMWQKMKLLALIVDSLIPRRDGQEIQKEDIEKLKESEQLHQMMAEFAEVMPQVKEPLIDERDKYLISSIEAADGQTIVAVVGAGHIPGMKAHFGQPVDRDALNRLPRRGWIGRLLKWVIPLLIVGFFYYGYSKNEGKSWEAMVWAWVIPNSVAAAVFTAAAGGKVLSIATATVASPITSLNPLLGAGMVVGLLEAWLRKPTVEDAERISIDAGSVRGVYRNRFTRVLLVAVMSTLGSAVGGWIGAFWLVGVATS